MKKILLILAILMTGQNISSAQNTKKILVDGEVLNYTLRLNWKFIWINAGKASLETRETTYNGMPAYTCTLIANTAKAADNIFRMRDTLQTLVTPRIEPILFQKRCIEGKDIINEQVVFTNNETEYHANIKKIYTDGSVREVDEQRDQLIFDMVSLMQYVRSLDIRNLKENEELKFYLAGGKRVDELPLRYLGYNNVESESKHKYRCQVFSLVKQSTNKKGKSVEEEVIRFFTTDDDCHIPVRLDLYLKFGVARVILN